MPDEQHDPGDVPPEYYLEKAGEDIEKSQRETPTLLESLRGSRIFFYPACGFDWNPLHRFTHLCDTFVYCDYRKTVEDFNNERSSIRREVTYDVGLELGQITHIDPNAVHDLVKLDVEEADDLPKLDNPWGLAIHLTRHIAGHQQKVLLMYFGVEGVTLYRNLFNKRSIAPRMICFKGCMDGFGGENWTTFLRWDGPLGRAVWENRARPEFIVSWYEHQDAPDRLGHRFDWPWSQVWQQHRNWQVRDDSREGDQLKSYVLPHALPASAGTPERYNSAIAHQQMRPIAGRTVIRLKRPDFNPASIPAGARQVSLSRENGSNLERVLRQLSESCAREGTEDVHAVGCHFEDEAPALHAWKWNSKHPKTLTIHCETEGDLACYGPAADEIVV